MVSVQGYLEISHKEMTEEEFGEFNAFLSNFMVYYHRIKIVGDREYYYCILKDDSILKDKEITIMEKTLPNNTVDESDSLPEIIMEEKTIIQHGLLTLMQDRNPILNGCWKRSGVILGTSILNEYSEPDKDGECRLINIEVIGEPEYSFDLDLHLKYTPDLVKYDEEGNEISRQEVVTYKPLHGFYGWIIGNEYDRAVIE